MKPYLNNVRITETGYLLHPHHKEPNDEPLVLESVKQLWLKLHPSHNDIIFDTESKPKLEASPLEGLQHFHGMSNKILLVINDIDKMQDRERFLSKEQKEERKERLTKTQRTKNQGKARSLQRQQEAHQRVYDNNSSTSQEEYSIHSLKAALRVVKTLNSIRLIFPVLIKIFQLDTKLKIGRKSQAKGKRWMTSKYVGTLKQQMALILKSLLEEDEIEEILADNFDWRCLQPKFLQRAKVSMNTPKLLIMDNNRLNEALKYDKAILKRIKEGRTASSDVSSFQKAVNNLMRRLESVLGSCFKGCRLEVYGSCLSDLSIEKASDVDISIYIPQLQHAKDRFKRGELSPSKYAAELKKYILSVQKKLSEFGNDFSQIVAVTSARVPVIKGCYLNSQNPHTKDSSLDFDICFFNDIAVRNSTLLKEYTLVDSRVKSLMLVVKKWAKDHKISSAADDRLSSYAWMILVIFYLQQLGMLPNLQCTGLMKRANFEVDANDSLNYINALNTAFVPWNQVATTKAWSPVKALKNIPVSVLLHGFFNYLSNEFAFGFYAVSIRRTNFTKVPKPAFNKCFLSFFCIEDPFETFESHCPHNLGNTVNPPGQKIITSLLSQGAKSLELILVGEKGPERGQLWDSVLKKGEKVEGQVSNQFNPSHKRNVKSTNGGNNLTTEKKPKHSQQGRKQQYARNVPGQQNKNKNQRRMVLIEEFRPKCNV